MSAVQSVFLTGASGYIGGSVALQLIRRGIEVRGLVRTGDGASALERIGIAPVVGSLDDGELLTREAARADAVINTASADHLAAVESLIKGLEGSGKPFIHTSGSSIVGDDARGSFCSSHVFDEDAPLLVQPLKQARRDIDLLVLKAAEKGVRSIVICPSLIYGQGRGLKKDSVQIPFLASNAIEHGVVQIVGKGENVWSNVHIDDVSELYVLALMKAPAGALYFAANGEASFLDIGMSLKTRLGLPTIESLDAETAAQRWGVPRALYSLGSNSRVRSKRAIAELGWQPRHASAIAWILNEMPVTAKETTVSV